MGNRLILPKNTFILYGVWSLDVWILDVDSNAILKPQRSAFIRQNYWIIFKEIFKKNLNKKPFHIISDYVCTPPPPFTRCICTFRTINSLVFYYKGVVMFSFCVIVKKFFLIHFFLLIKYPLFKSVFFSVDYCLFLNEIK